MNIGDSDLKTTGIALGGNTFGWTADVAQTADILDAFVELGGTLVDTADVYSAWAEGNEGGESEAAMGQWLEKPGNHKKLAVATKVSQKPGREGLAPENVRKAAEESLERLRIDQIDLYYAHQDDADVPMDEMAHAFSELASEGLIKEIGLSNFEPDRLELWMEVAKDKGYKLPVALQPHYNLVFRKDFEAQRQDFARKWNLAVFPYFSLAAGFLTGKYERDTAINGDRASMVDVYVNDQAYDVVDALRKIASAQGVTPAAVALAWLRARDTVAAPLASARNVEQLEQIMPGAQLELSDTDLTVLTELSKGL
ncbi:aldo/keto reductase [Gleimia hominis]|uniref:aldo/keto reductase n=1 Tax=Gleimia hominis TaxID=595468 RepID=UPI000C7FF9F7|nr:aldo/keto reductase [Gleimia hominis]WIK64010.1 aldo/keto reductase [Gleimia hominis]